MEFNSRLFLPISFFHLASKLSPCESVLFTIKLILLYVDLISTWCDSSIQCTFRWVLWMLLTRMRAYVHYCIALNVPVSSSNVENTFWNSIEMFCWITKQYKKRYIKITTDFFPEEFKLYVQIENGTSRLFHICA